MNGVDFFGDGLMVPSRLSCFRNCEYWKSGVLNVGYGNIDCFGKEGIVTGDLFNEDGYELDDCQ